MGDRTTTGTREMMGGGKDGATLASGPPSEKVSQDGLSNPCDAWSMTELVGTKTEIKGGSQAKG